MNTIEHYWTLSYTSCGGLRGCRGLWGLRVLGVFFAQLCPVVAQKSVFCYRTSETIDLVPSDQFFDFSFLSYSSFRKKKPADAPKSLPPPPSASNSPCALSVQAHARLNNFNEWKETIARWPLPQRPEKSELSEWQNSTCKNFPDEVRKSFLRPKSAYIVFRDKKIHEIAIWSHIQRDMCCFCNIITSLCWHSHTSLMHKLKTFSIIKDFSDHQKISRLSGNFPDQPDTFQIM